MARIENPGIGITLTGNANDTGFLTSPLSKLWRARILHHRATSNMSQSDKQGNPGPEVNSREKNTETTRKNREQQRDRVSVVGRRFRENQNGSILKPLTQRTITNQILIINPNTSPITNLIIQGMPREIMVNPESSWATVKSMGRNNPFMFYTGSEDTISFEISWYAVDGNREDVINKCRLLESWTKADGYRASPPVLYISWGNSGMFENDSFILYSAPYVLSNFQNSCRRGDRENPIIEDLRLLPNIATQELVFKRVTSDNRTHEQIIPVSKLKTTTGVKY